MNTSVFVVALLRSALLCIHTKNISSSPRNKAKFFSYFFFYVYLICLCFCCNSYYNNIIRNMFCQTVMFLYFCWPVPLLDSGGRRSHKHIYRVWLMMAWERFNPSPGGFLGPAWLIFKPIVWLTSLATPCLSSHIWIQNGILQVFQCFVDIIYLLK